MDCCGINANLYHYKLAFILFWVEFIQRCSPIYLVMVVKKISRHLHIYGILLASYIFPFGISTYYSCRDNMIRVFIFLEIVTHSKEIGVFYREIHKYEKNSEFDKIIFIIHKRQYRLE